MKNKMVYDISSELHKAGSRTREMGGTRNTLARHHRISCIKNVLSQLAGEKHPQNPLGLPPTRFLPNHVIV